MKVIWTLGAALLTAMSIQAEECATVMLTNVSMAPPEVLLQAKTISTGIFGGIGVNLRWGRKPDACPARVEVRLETASGPGERKGSLAYTTLGGDGDKRIHVFVDRVNAMLGRAASGTLMGHVLAHEIAHVLEGVARHSDSGIMKAHWGPEDLHALLTHSLRFALVDDALIHAALSGEPAEETINP